MIAQKRVLWTGINSVARYQCAIYGLVIASRALSSAGRG